MLPRQSPQKITSSYSFSLKTVAKVQQLIKNDELRIKKNTENEYLLQIFAKKVMQLNNNMYLCRVLATTRRTTLICLRKKPISNVVLT
jgi:hypothetical protein